MHPQNVGFSGFQDKVVKNKFMSHHSQGMMPLPWVAKINLLVALYILRRCLSSY